MDLDLYEKLVVALGGGGWNARPARLRQGTIFGIDLPEDPHELDVVWASITGSPGYQPYPPTDWELWGEPERTPEQVEEVTQAIIRWRAEQDKGQPQ